MLFSSSSAWQKTRLVRASLPMWGAVCLFALGLAVLLIFGAGIDELVRILLGFFLVIVWIVVGALALKRTALNRPFSGSALSLSCESLEGQTTLVGELKLASGKHLHKPLRVKLHVSGVQGDNTVDHSYSLMAYPCQTPYCHFVIQQVVPETLEALQQFAVHCQIGEVDGKAATDDWQAIARCFVVLKRVDKADQVDAPPQSNLSPLNTDSVPLAVSTSGSQETVIQAPAFITRVEPAKNEAPQVLEPSAEISESLAVERVAHRKVVSSANTVLETSISTQTIELSGNSEAIKTQHGDLNDVDWDLSVNRTSSLLPTDLELKSAFLVIQQAWQDSGKPRFPMVNAQKQGYTDHGLKVMEGLAHGNQSCVEVNVLPNLNLLPINGKEVNLSIAPKKLNPGILFGGAAVCLMVLWFITSGFMAIVFTGFGIWKYILYAQSKAPKHALKVDQGSLVVRPLTGDTEGPVSRVPADELSGIYICVHILEGKPIKYDLYLQLYSQRFDLISTPKLLVLVNSLRNVFACAINLSELEVLIDNAQDSNR